MKFVTAKKIRRLLIQYLNKFNKRIQYLVGDLNDKFILLMNYNVILINGKKN